MFDANDIKRKLGDTFTEDQIQTLTEVLREGYVGLATSVDMRDLKDAVKDLAIAQARSEKRLDRVETAIEKLTEAQARSEKRLDRIEAAIEKLTAAQARSEERLDRIEAAIEKLAAAQARSEKRLDHVEERLDRIEAAQARSEERLDRIEAAIEKLAAAQARSEKRLDRVEERLDRIEAAIEKLTEAQIRSEKRLDRVEAAQARSEERLDRIEAAQARSEERLDRIEAAIEKLTEAQIRSEKRLDRVEAAQARSEERLDTLTERLDTLVKEHGKTRSQLGGLAMTVGYTLENAAYRALPDLLKADYGIEVQDRLIRTYLTDDKNRSLEVNIFGKGLKNGREVVILGESKSQLSERHINRFIFTRLDHLKPLFGEVLPILVTHMISSEGVAAYAKEQGIALYYSYQF